MDDSLLYCFVSETEIKSDTNFSSDELKKKKKIFQASTRSPRALARSTAAAREWSARTEVLFIY